MVRRSGVWGGEVGVWGVEKRGMVSKEEETGKTLSVT